MEAIKAEPSMIKLSSLDKSNWKQYRFDEIAKSVSERVDPNNTDLEIYIGLEHLDSGSVHIKRFGKPEDVSGQKLKFYKGDVIFGRRRAYQRKAGIATFDGFCSAHALVLRANPEVIDPDLFPFFLHSDSFMNRAIDISVGSLSPTINWGALKEERFLLPPLDQQHLFSKLFWALDASSESNILLKKKMNRFLEAEIEQKIHGEKINGYTINQVIDNLEEKISISSLGSLGEVFKGKGIPKADVVEEGIPCVRYGELYTKHHRIIREFHSSISSESTKAATKLECDDVLFAGSGETISEIGKSAAFTGNDIAYAGSDILIFRPRDMDGVYSGYLMNSQLVRQQLNKLGTGATVMHVYKTDIESIKVPARKRKLQEEIGVYLENISNRIFILDEKINATSEFQKQIINQVF